MVTQRPLPPPIVGWHFLSVDRRLSHDDGRFVRVGETLSTQGAVLCRYGLHACGQVKKARYYFRFTAAYSEPSILCRVQLGEDAQGDGEKWVSRWRTCLDMRIFRDADWLVLAQALASALSTHDEAVTLARQVYDDTVGLIGDAYNAETARVTAPWKAARAAGSADFDEASNVFNAALAVAAETYTKAHAPLRGAFTKAVRRADAALEAATARIELEWYATLPPVEARA